jgi:hypothetical protein
MGYGDKSYTDAEAIAAAKSDPVYADDVFEIDDDGDSTKDIVFQLAGATTGKTMTITSSQTDNRNVTLPDATGTLALTGAAPAAHAIDGAAHTGEGDSVTKDVGTGAGDVAAGNAPGAAQAAAILASCQRASNLSDVASAATSRTNLGVDAAGTARPPLWTTTSKSANWTASAWEIVICTANTFQVDLPAGPSDNDQVIVKNRGAGTITVDGNGDTIDGAATAVISSQWESLTLRSDGTTWDIV